MVRFLKHLYTADKFFHALNYLDSAPLILSTLFSFFDKIVIF